MHVAKSRDTLYGDGEMNLLEGAQYPIISAEQLPIYPPHLTSLSTIDHHIPVDILLQMPDLSILVMKTGPLKLAVLPRSITDLTLSCFNLSEHSCEDFKCLPPGLLSLALDLNMQYFHAELFQWLPPSLTRVNLYGKNLYRAPIPNISLQRRS